VAVPSRRRESDLHIHATTGEIIRELILKPGRRLQQGWPLFTGRWEYFSMFVETIYAARPGLV
jgi:hypothetical protein